MALARWWWEHS